MNLSNLNSLIKGDAKIGKWAVSSPKKAENQKRLSGIYYKLKQQMVSRAHQNQQSQNRFQQILQSNIHQIKRDLIIKQQKSQTQSFQAQNKQLIQDFIQAAINFEKIYEMSNSNFIKVQQVYWENEFLSNTNKNNHFESLDNEIEELFPQKKDSICFSSPSSTPLLKKNSLDSPQHKNSQKKQEQQKVEEFQKNNQNSSEFSRKNSEKKNKRITKLDKLIWTDNKLMTKKTLKLLYSVNSMYQEYEDHINVFDSIQQKNYKIWQENYKKQQNCSSQQKQSKYDISQISLEFKKQKDDNAKRSSVSSESSNSTATSNSNIRDGFYEHLPTIQSVGDEEIQFQMDSMRLKFNSEFRQIQQNNNSNYSNNNNKSNINSNFYYDSQYQAANNNNLEEITNNFNGYQFSGFKEQQQQNNQFLQQNNQEQQNAQKKENITESEYDEESEISDCEDNQEILKIQQFNQNSIQIDINSNNQSKYNINSIYGQPQQSSQFQQQQKQQQLEQNIDEIFQDNSNSNNEYEESENIDDENHSHQDENERHGKQIPNQNLCKHFKKSKQDRIQ